MARTKTSAKPVSKSSSNSWFKNATKAVGYSALEVTKSSNPFITGTVSNSMNAFSDLKNWVKHNTPFRSSPGGSTQEKKLFKTASNLVRAGFEDIKSGHLDFAGLNEKVGKMLGDVTEDYDAWPDEGGDLASFDFDAGVTNDTFLSGVEVQSRATIGAIEQSTDILARTQASGLDLLAKRNQASSIIMTSKITEQLITSNKYMQAMSGNIATLVQQNNDFTEFRNAQLQFMENTEQGINDIREILNNIADMQSRMVPSVNKNSYGNDSSDDFISGGFDIKALGKRIWDKSILGTTAQMLLMQYAPVLGFLGFDVSKIDSFGGGGLDLNPIKFAMKKSSLFKSLETFNTRLEDYTKMLFSKLSDGITGIGMSLLGIDVPNPTNLLSNPRMGKYEKGVAAWSGQDQRALREVIPGYLSKIEANTSILAQRLARLDKDSYNEEVFKNTRHFDENAGVFKSSEAIMKDFQERMDMTITSAASTLSDMFVKYTDGSDDSKLQMASILNDIYNKDGYTSKESVQQIGKILKDHMRSVEDSDTSQEARVIKAIKSNPKLLKNLVREFVDELDRSKVESASNRERLFSSVASRENVAYRVLNDNSGLTKKYSNLTSDGKYRGDFRASNLETLESQEIRRRANMTEEERKASEQAQRAKEFGRGLKDKLAATKIGQGYINMRNKARNTFGIGATQSTREITGRGINTPLNFLTNGMFGLLHGGNDAFDFDEAAPIAIDPRVLDENVNVVSGNTSTTTQTRRVLNLRSTNNGSSDSRREVYESIIDTIPSYLRQIAENTRSFGETTPTPTETQSNSTTARHRVRKISFKRREASNTENMTGVPDYIQDQDVSEETQGSAGSSSANYLDPERVRMLNDQNMEEASRYSFSQQSTMNSMTEAEKANERHKAEKDAEENSSARRYRVLKRQIRRNSVSGNSRAFMDQNALRSDDPEAALNLEQADSLATIAAATTENNVRLFGKNGFITEFVKGSTIGKLFEKLKHTLFGEKGEDGFYTDGPLSDLGNSLVDFKKSITHFFSGKKYTDSMGNEIAENDNAVFKHLGNSFATVRDSIYTRYLGEDYKSGDVYKNLPNWAKAKEDRVSRRTNQTQETTQNLQDAAAKSKPVKVKLRSSRKKEDTPNGTLADQVVQEATQEANEEIHEIIYGSAEDQSNKEVNAEKLLGGITKKIKDSAPKAVAAGILGAGIGASAAGGIIPALFGISGPVGGAIAGIGISLISQSDKLKEKLFGKEDENGNKVGGIISQKFQQSVKKKMPWLISGGVLGAAKAVIAPSALAGLGAIPAALFGGVLGPAILGAGMGLLASSEKLKNSLFGERTGDGEKSQGAIAKAMTAINTFLNKNGAKQGISAIVGGGAGALLSVLGAPVLGPAGPILSAIAGASIGIMGSSERFNEMLFGTKILDKDGKVTGRKRDSIMDKMGNYLKVHFDEMAVWGNHMVNEVSNFVKADIIAPMKTITAGIKDRFSEVVGDFKQTLANITDGVVKGVKTVFSPLTKAVTTISHSLLRGGMKGFEFIAKTTGSVVSMPLKLASFLISKKDVKKMRWAQLKEFLGNAPVDFFNDLKDKFGEDSVAGKLFKFLGDGYAGARDALSDAVNSSKNIASFLLHGTWDNQQVSDKWHGLIGMFGSGNMPGFMRTFLYGENTKEGSNWKGVKNYLDDFTSGLKDVITAPFKNWARVLKNPLALFSSKWFKGDTMVEGISNFAGAVKDSASKHLSKRAYIESGIEAAKKNKNPVAVAAFEQQLAKLDKKEQRKDDKNKDKLNKYIQQWAKADNYNRAAEITGDGKNSLNARKNQIAKLTGLKTTDWTQEDVKAFMYDFGARGNPSEFKTIAQQAQDEVEAKKAEKQAEEKSRENIQNISDNTASANELIREGFTSVIESINGQNVSSETFAAADDISGSGDITPFEEEQQKIEETKEKNDEAAKKAEEEGKLEDQEKKEKEAKKVKVKVKRQEEREAAAKNAEQKVEEQKKEEERKKEETEQRKKDALDSKRAASLNAQNMQEIIDNANAKRAAQEEKQRQKEQTAAEDEKVRSNTQHDDANDEGHVNGELEDQSTSSGSSKSYKSEGNWWDDLMNSSPFKSITSTLKTVGTIALPFAAITLFKNPHLIVDFISKVPEILTSIGSTLGTLVTGVGDFFKWFSNKASPMLDSFSIGEDKPSDFNGALTNGENIFEAAGTALFGFKDKSKNRNRTWVDEYGNEHGIQNGHLLNSIARATGKSILRKNGLTPSGLIKQSLNLKFANVAAGAAEKVAGKTGREAVEAAAEKAAKEASSTAVKAGSKVAASAISSILDKFAKSLEKKAFKNIASESKGIIKAIKTLLGKLESGLAKKAGKLSSAMAESAATTSTKAVPVVGWIITGVTVVWDATTGAIDAPNLFYVHKEDVTPGMRLVSSLLKVVLGFGIGPILDVVSEVAAEVLGIDLKNSLASLIYKLLPGTDPEALADAQAKFQSDRETYNQINGTNLSSKAYNEMMNATVGTKIFNTVKSGVTSLGKSLGIVKESTATSNVSSRSQYNRQSVEDQASEGYGKLQDQQTSSGDHYSQTDNRWKDVRFGEMNNGRVTTIGTGGCGPTALANVYKHLTGKKDVTPTTVANMAIDSGYTTNGGSNAGLFTEGAYRLGLRSQQINPNPGEMQTRLMAGQSLIVSGTKKGTNSPYTSSGHIISIRKAEGNNVVVDDPLKSNSSKMPLSNVMAGLNKVWALDSSNGYGNAVFDKQNLGYGPFFWNEETQEYEPTTVGQQGRRIVDLFADIGYADKPARKAVFYPMYQQEWSDLPYGGSSLGNIGCLIHSLAMAMSNLTGAIDIDPGFLATIFPAQDGGLGSTQPAEMAKLIDATYKRVDLDDSNDEEVDDAKEDIISILKRGLPVILGGKYGEDYQHHVLINGFKTVTKGDKTIDYTELFDPGRSDGSGYGFHAFDINDFFEAVKENDYSSDYLSYMKENFGIKNLRMYRYFDRDHDITEEDTAKFYERFKKFITDGNPDYDVKPEAVDTYLKDINLYKAQFQTNGNSSANQLSANLTDTEYSSLAGNVGDIAGGLSEGSSGLEAISEGFASLFGNISKIAYNIFESILGGKDYVSIFGTKAAAKTGQGYTPASIDPVHNGGAKAVENANSAYINFGEGDNGEPLLVDASKSKALIVSKVLNEQFRTLVGKYRDEKKLNADEKQKIIDCRTNGQTWDADYINFVNWATARIANTYDHAIKYNKYYSADGKALRVDSQGINYYSTATVSGYGSTSNYSTNYPSWALTNMGYINTQSNYKSSRMSQQLQDALALRIGEIVPLHESTTPDMMGGEDAKYFTPQNMDGEDRTTFGLGFFGATGSEALTRLAKSGQVSTETANEALKWAKRMNESKITGSELTEFTNFLRREDVRSPLKTIQDAMTSQLSMQYVERAGKYYDQGIINDPRSIILAGDMYHASGSADFIGSYVDGDKDISKVGVSEELSAVRHNMLNHISHWGNYSLYEDGWTNRINDTYNLMTTGNSSKYPGFSMALPDVIKQAVPKDAEGQEVLGYGNPDQIVKNFRINNYGKTRAKAPALRSSSISGEKGSFSGMSSSNGSSRSAIIHSNNSFNRGVVGYGNADKNPVVDMTPMESKTDKLIYLLEKVVNNTAKTASNNLTSTNITNYNNTTNTRNEISYGDVNSTGENGNNVVVVKGQDSKINQNYTDKLRLLHEKIARSPRH